MTTLTTKYFSAVDYMQRLRKVNFTEEQAEIIAKEAEDIISNILEQTNVNLERRDLITKQDLHLALKELEIKLIKWILGVGIGIILAIAGILKYVIH